MKLKNILIVVNDMERSIKFYQELFGLQVILDQDGNVIMTEGLVLASDGFFPFNDCVALAAEYGIKAIVQPGGSIRDEDSIKLANEKGITMLFTGERHFKH